jgi:hypothetical protein
MSRKNTFLFGLMLVFIIGLLFIYENSDFKITLLNYTLKKSAELEIREKKPNPPIKKRIIAPVKKEIEILQNKRILLAGDSEAGSIVYEIQKYAVLNGHNLCRTIIWNSASDNTYANTDTLKNNIQRFKPEYIIFVIGLNQVFQKYFDNTKTSIQKILEEFKDIPYTWVGPANWVKDNGINQVYQENIDSGAFFLSGNLILERGTDGRHPSTSGSKKWVDSICYFLTNKAKYRIKMEKIDTAFKRPRLNMLNLTVKSN